MSRMILIASGAYVDQDLIAEIGLLPPAFLPVGNQRLFTFQLKLLEKSVGDIYLSIPEDYSVEEFDQRLLRLAKVSKIRVPRDLSLGTSILYCWNAAGKKFDTLTILHGDTLFTELDTDIDDALSLHPNQGLYQRAIAQDILLNNFQNAWATEEETVVSGYFSLADPHLFMKGIVESHGSFVEALKFYGQQRRLTGLSKGLWLDFGHINSFFKSRTTVTTQRVFNDMAISHRSVRKSSSDKEKMSGEAHWFDNLPEPLRIHTPALLRRPVPTNAESASYELEYLYLMPLSDIFVYGALTSGVMAGILRSTKAVLQDFRQFKPEWTYDYATTSNIYLKKTRERLNHYAEQSGFDLSLEIRANRSDRQPVSLTTMAEESARYIMPTTERWVGISHGDFCFSNILYDSRSSSVKVIDPRGLDGNRQPTIYGDIRYDVAKLYHSAVGLFDFIIAGRFEVPHAVDNDIFQISFFVPGRILESESLFAKAFFQDGEFNEAEILAINVQLFLSMLPLHHDRPDRQRAMIANALRLFKKLTALNTEPRQVSFYDSHTNGRAFQAL